MQPPESTTCLQVAPGKSLPLSALQFTFARSGGPGGQNVNKLNTRATLTVGFDQLATVLPDWALQRLQAVAGLYMITAGLQITCDESRSQHANKQACLDKLRQVLLQALHRPKVRRKTKPSFGSVQRRLQSKKMQSQRKADRRGDGLS